MNIAVEKYNKITAIGVGTSNRTSHHIGNCSPNTIRCFQLRTACSDFIENYSKGRIIENMTLHKPSSNFETCVNWQPMIERFKNCIVLQSKN